MTLRCLFVFRLEGGINDNTKIKCMFRVFVHRRAPARTPTAASNASAPAATSWTTAERSASTGSSSHLKLTSAVADGEVE